MPLNPNSDLPPIFVINRQSDTSRRGDMTERLAKVGLTPTFFPPIMTGESVAAISARI